MTSNNSCAHRDDGKSHKYLPLISNSLSPNNFYLVSSECQKCSWLPDWRETVTEGKRVERERAIIISAKILSRKFIKMYDSVYDSGTFPWPWKGPIKVRVEA